MYKHQAHTRGPIEVCVYKHQAHMHMGLEVHDKVHITAPVSSKCTVTCPPGGDLLSTEATELALNTSGVNQGIINVIEL